LQLGNVANPSFCYKQLQNHLEKIEFEVGEWLQVDAVTNDPHPVQLCCAWPL
jgi:hypothetical protein